jgi:sugar phosphate isomerase/epimerase
MGMDLQEFPAMVAKRFGVRNINPLGDHLSSTDPGYLAEFRAAVEAAGSHIVDFGLGGKDFGHPDKAVRDEAVAYGRRWIDIAVLIGSPSVRQHLRTAQGANPSVANSVESLGRLADYGAQKNIVVNLENDSPGAEDPFYIVEVLNKVSSPYLRALPDFGNSLRGHDAAYNEKAVDAMFKHAYNMSHVKDALRTKAGEVYRVDVERMFAVARANSYKGYFSMEFDTATGDPFEGTANLVSQSLKFM